MLVTVAAVVYVVPFVIQDSYLIHLLVLGCIYAGLASSWDLTLGYAGVFNFAHVAIFAVSAYAAAIATTELRLNPWLGLLVGSVFGSITGAIAFVPAIRLRGVYVALSTFAFAQICMYVVNSQREFTGGTQGKVGIPPLALGDFLFTGQNRWASFYVAAALLVVTTALLRSVVRSNLGISLIAIRDSEEYAMSRGMNVARQHLLAFLVGSIAAGAFGAFYAYYIGAVTPNLFGFPYAALLLSMVWLGGVGSIYGPILGAFILTFGSEALAQYGPWRFIVVSLVIIVTLLVLPGGLWSVLVRMTRGRRGGSPPRSVGSLTKEATP